MWIINAPSATETAIERRAENEPATNYKEIAAVPTPTRTYVDSSLTTGLIYCYRLRSRTPATTSFYSDEVCLLARITGVVLIYAP